MPFENFAVVELMGHARIAGKVSEQVIAGSAMLRVDVPKTSTTEPYTKFYAPNAVYCITPVDEAAALAVAERFAEAPVQPWMLANVSSPALVAKITEPEDELEDDDYDDDENEWDF